MRSKLAVRDLRWIVNNPHRFSVASGLGADLVVGRGFGRAARVARRGVENALDAFEDGLCTPEAAAGEDCGLFPRCMRHLNVGYRGRDWSLARSFGLCRVQRCRSQNYREHSDQGKESIHGEPPTWPRLNQEQPGMR